MNFWPHSNRRGARLLTFGISLVCIAEGLHGLSLTDRSPFIPSGFSANSTGPANTTNAAANQALEFRGMYKLGGAYYFLVSSPNSPGKWLSVGESDEGMTIKDYAAGEDRLLVEYNGSPLWLELSEMAALTGGSAGRANTTTPAAIQRRPGTPVTRTASGVRPSRSSTQRVIRPSSAPPAARLSRSGNTTARTRFPTRSPSRNPNLVLPDPPQSQPTPPPQVPELTPPDFIPGSPPSGEDFDSPFD